MMLFWCAVTIRSVWITGILGRVTWRGRTYDSASVTSGM